MLPELASELFLAEPSLAEFSIAASWLPYVSAFLVGMVGGVHCLGMCGGIVGSLTMSLPAEARRSTLTMLPYHLNYNLGRMCSYVVAGAIMGGLASLLLQGLPLYITQRLLLGLAGVLMVLLGLYIGGWWMLLNRVEKVGARLWRHLEPLSRHFMPVRRPSQALMVGLVWGWLPCGLVYSMLINAVATGSAIKGAGLMLAFALGTLPNLLIMGFLAGAAAHLLQSPLTRKLAGALIIAFGLWSLYRVL